MQDALDRAAGLIASYAARVGAEAPAGAEIFDAHTHLGNDIDGMWGELDELLRIHDRHGVSGSFMFCLDEPDRHPAFRAANDRTLDYARRSGGRLIPFVRLDLAEDPIAEAVRCLDLGARGIKLHPRAQGFMLTDDRLEPVFALAEERRVPILIHGGRGLPRISADLGRLVDKHPGAQLIIAHAGIADLAGLAGVFSGHAGVFFDTSVWSVLDLLDFFRQVSPEQVLYASDYPYGRQPNSLFLALRAARISGYGDAEVRGMLAGNARRIVDGMPALEPTAPIGGATTTQHLILARIHGYLSMATSLLWLRRPDTFGVMGLALNACEEGGSVGPVLERIRPLLEAAAELWRELASIEDDTQVLATGRVVFQLLHLADIESLTGAA